MIDSNLRNIFVLRTPQMLEEYAKHVKKNKGSMAFFFSSPAIKSWEYWRLIKNDFPYDVLAGKHHILTPKRIFAEDIDMTNGERKELSRIKAELNDDYDSMIENFIRNRTFRTHYHLHLICYKKNAK